MEVRKKSSTGRAKYVILEVYTDTFSDILDK
jgi:hypothetical protein